MITTIIQIMPSVKADPTLPTVATNDATEVGTTYATLQGTLTDDGGENSITGFEYGLTTEYGTKVALRYVYAGGASVQTVNQYFKSDMSKVAETEAYGGTIRAIVEDDDYVYAGGQTNGNVVQYWKSNMTMKAEASYDPVISDIAQDDLYVYAGGQAQRVYQYLKSDMSFVAQTDLIGGDITAIAVDDTYVYASTGSTVSQYWKSNMTNTGISANYGSGVRKIVSDTDYVYVIGGAINKVYQYWNLNMTKKAEASYGDVYALTQDDTYVYAGGGTTYKVFQYWKSNMTKKAETISYGGEIEALTQDDLYIYAGGETTKKVRQYLKSDMSFVAESVSYGSTIYALSTSNDTHATGDTFSFNATGLIRGTLYHYCAYANNSIGEASGADKTFNTIAENLPPSFSNESPADASLFQPLSLTWNITIQDLNGDTFNWSIECNNSQSNSSNNDVNGSKQLDISGLSYSTEYTVWVNATDLGSGNYTSAVYTFTTFDGYYWHEATSNANWSARGCSGALVFDNKLWVLGGGAVDGIKNDVWNSENGINWNLVTEHAGWSPRYLSITLVYDEKMWVIGGTNGSNWDNCSTDAWYSTDGINWIEATSDINTTSNAFNAGVVYDGKMWLSGGDYHNANDNSYLNEVWYSTDGVNWTSTGGAGWAGRDCHTMLSYDGKMWVMGGMKNGYTTDGYNDVWWTTDGANWTLATDNAGWAGRYAHGTQVYDDKMWIMGGFSYGTLRNDVWYSTDGVNWVEQIDNASWSERCWLSSSAVVYDNHLWLITGDSANDTWYLDYIINYPPAFGTPSPTNGSTGQPPSLTWNITIQDIDGDTFDWSIECSNSQSNSSNNDVNGSKQLDISGLSYSTEYTVWVNATDGTNWTREWFTFTTEANTIPVISNENPTNNSIDQPLALTWNCTITDPDELMNWTIECNNSQTASGTSATGSIQVALSGLSYLTTYTVWVNITDGYAGISEWFIFTTMNIPNNAPVFSNENPANGSINQPIDFLDWTVDVNDPEGDLMDISINCSHGEYEFYDDWTNGTYDIELSDLDYNTTYTVWVNATDGTDWTRAWYLFTTRNNTPPAYSDENPPNGTIGQPLSFTWNINITDDNGDTIWWSLACSNGDMNTSGEGSAPNGTIYLDILNLTYSTEYIVWVNTSDGYSNVSEWFTFTTVLNNPPDEPNNPTPTNNSPYTNVYLYLNCTVTDPDGDNMTVVFKWQNGTTIATLTDITNDSIAGIWLPDYQLIGHDTDYYWYVVVSDGIENTTSPIWTFHTNKAWDLNGDSTTNYLDVSALVSHYGEMVSPPGSQPWDINNDGNTNYLDVSALVSHYGESY